MASPLDGHADRQTDSEEKRRGLHCARLKASHSSGNVEMVKEIGMRVGGPSEIQVRGMRSEGEMGERVRKKPVHTFNREAGEKTDKRQ